MSNSREVFRLRKAGESEQALVLARRLIQVAPDDEWAIRAYGWSLHDCIKRAGEVHDRSEKTNLIDELKALVISEEDESLFKVRESWIDEQARTRQNPDVVDLIDLCITARKNDDLKTAWRLGQEAVQQFPKDPEASSALGWVVRDRLKRALQEQQIDGDVVRERLREYAKLPAIQKPDRLHSRILRDAIRAVRADAFPGFIGFFRWWDPDCFLEEDLLSDAPFMHRGKHVRPDSLHLRSMSALYASIDDKTPEPDLEWVSGLIEKAREDRPDHRWLPYWHGSLLVRLGEQEKARELVLPTVLRDRHEAWAWLALARTYRDSDFDLHLACLCRAARCDVHDEGYKLGVYVDLVAEFERREMLPEAKFELERIVSIREERRWKDTPYREKLASESYSSIEASVDNEKVFDDFAPLADEVLFATSTTGSGWLLSTDSKPLTIGLMLDGALKSIPLQSLEYDYLLDEEAGTALLLRYQLVPGEEPIIIEVQKRDAPGWDGLDPVIGVVEHINHNKSVSVALTGDRSVCLVHHRHFPAARNAPLGSFVKVRTDETSRKEVCHALTFEPTEDQPAASFYQRFEGTLTLTPGEDHGFVMTGDGIRAHLSQVWLERMSLRDQQPLKGAIARKWLKDRKTFSWTVVDVSQTEVDELKIE